MDARRFLTRWAEAVIADFGPDAPSCRVVAVGVSPGPRTGDSLDVEVGSWDELAARFGEPPAQVRIEIAVADEGATGLSLLTDAGAHGVEAVASSIQDYLVESAVGWGQTLPPCPDHSHHPLSPDLDAGVAVWRCPTDRHVVRPIPTARSVVD